MKPFLYIEKHVNVGINSEYEYYSISDALTNKNWIIQYNTTLDQIIHYAMGYSEALNYDHNIYFAKNVNLSKYPELELFKLDSEEHFQKMREAITKK